MKKYVVTRNVNNREIVKQEYNSLGIAKRYFNEKIDMHIYEKEINYIFDEQGYPISKKIKTSLIR